MNSKFTNSNLLILTSPPQDIHDSIQICGRIAPEQVYYYLEELKQTGREITVLKFIPANDSEKISYKAYFDYMHDRNRFGVVTNTARSIKDFYIIPLARDQDPHPSLLPFNGIGLEENRPDYLLGVLVRKSKPSLNHQHSKSDSADRSGHYSPSYSYRPSAIVSTTPPRNDSSKSRSYTPPPPTRPRHQAKGSGSENSNSMDDGSYTPPRKEKYQDEPYDPEQGLDFGLIKRTKRDHRQTPRSVETEPIAESAGSTPTTDEPPRRSKEPQKQISPTKNLANLLEYLNRVGKLSEKGSTSTILNEIAKISTSEEQQLLLKEIRRKVEESERQLEIQRKAAENAFSQATTSNNFDSNCIPGLDGDFSSVDDAKQSEEASSQLDPSDLQIPDSWKEIIEKYSNPPEITKSSEYRKINGCNGLVQL